MTKTEPLGTSSCRSVTAEEVEHYQELGWVKLKAFADPTTLNHLLKMAKEKMGEDGDGNKLHAGDGGLAYFNTEFANGLQNPLMRPLIEQVGKNARLLMRRKSGVGVRYYKDFFIPKLPSGKETKHRGNGPTAFHQDFTALSVDRSGGMNFWIPLEAYGASSGTMSFISRSHRLGVLGDYTTYGAGDVRDAFPELEEMELSEPMTYEIGDITVHSHLTIHGAQPNTTDKPRWVYVVIAEPADIRWNGQPSPNFDTSSMRPMQPFSDERMPLIG